MAIGDAFVVGADSNSDAQIPMHRPQKKPLRRDRPYQPHYLCVPFP